MGQWNPWSQFFKVYFRKEKQPQQQSNASCILTNFCSVIYKTPQTEQNSSKCRFKSDGYNLQAREEENARQRAEERERLEQQKQELHAKFRRRVPPKFHPLNLGRKDSVQRETDLDISENLLVSPVRSRNKEHVSTEVDESVHVS